MSDAERPSTTLSGKVERIIPPLGSREPEKAEISVEGADDLYGEIRIENTMTNAEGEVVTLKPGAQVNVTIEANAEDTTIKKIHESSGKIHTADFSRKIT